MEDDASQPRPDGVRVPPICLPPDLVGLGGDDDNQELFELLSRVSVAINSRYDLSGSSPETLDPDTVQNLVRMLQSRRSYYEDQIRLEQLVERPASLARYIARSARLRTSSAETVCSGNIAMPMLHEQWCDTCISSPIACGTVK